MGKNAKREKGRGIERRHWHVRGLMEQLSDVRCKTIAGNKYPEGCSFSTCITAMLVLSWESIA